ncbi:hypothetical protein QBZ16_001181 [Prototheca wickerhamii]|uniref:MHD domain-containing protein n=1 Tax=Prototheca wickerhamii TaxID=3111 RepID=A0AAD9IDR1_PROWI|nr:hypothetical protein QBZ16_001181 [Prototheca wickerhamii]
MEDTLLGFSIPFPRSDLYVALALVVCYIPAVIVLNWVAHRVIDLVRGKKVKTHQVFLVSPRGDCVIFKDFRGDVPKSAPETFAQKAQAAKSLERDLAPAVDIDGVQYLHVKLLLRFTAICRDYFGRASEEGVRRNLPLVYELLDEVMDFGFAQDSQTDRLKQYIRIEPQTEADQPLEVVKSVLDTTRTGPSKDEIFVDIVERLTATFDPAGRLKTAAIAGALQIKSYLSGNPPISLGLSEDLVIHGRPVGPGAGYGASGSDAVVLDTCSFHQAVDQQRLERDGVLELVPPEGYFSAMTYRSTKPFRPPLRVVPILEDDIASAEKLTLYLRVRAEFPVTKTATSVEVRVPLPRAVQRVNVETDGAKTAGGLALAAASKSVFSQNVEWVPKDRVIVWNLRHLRGGKEHTLKARLTIDVGSAEAVKRDYGPITVQFVLPGKPSASGLDVRYMKIQKNEKNYNPARWFRVVTVAGSYQVRPHWL